MGYLKYLGNQHNDCVASDNVVVGRNEHFLKKTICLLLIDKNKTEISTCHAHVNLGFR